MTKPNTIPAIDRRSPSADSGGHFHAVALSGGKDSSYLLLRMIELDIDAGRSFDAADELGAVSRYAREHDLSWQEAKEALHNGD